MAAIEYGSYYWCVILNGKEPNVPGESVFLHADELALDPAGALIFKSAGRRPAGAEPKQPNGKHSDKDSSENEKNEREDDKNGKGGGDGKEARMIYMAFAAGSWRSVYAAKLQDGAPASCRQIPAPWGFRVASRRGRCNALGQGRTDAKR
jgi:hypothetical protein